MSLLDVHVAESDPIIIFVFVRIATRKVRNTIRGGASTTSLFSFMKSCSGTVLCVQRIDGAGRVASINTEDAGAGMAGADLKDHGRALGSRLSGRTALRRARSNIGGGRTGSSGKKGSSRSDIASCLNCPGLLSLTLTQYRTFAEP
jgi:hypothetical protein